MSNRWLAPEDHGLSFPHPSAPLLVATNASWKRWKKDDTELGQAFEGVLGEGSADDATGFALPGFEQGRIWIAAAEDAVWIVHWFGPEDDAGPSTAWRTSTTHTEYLAGTFTVPKGGASVGDAWHEARWPLPLPPGKYVVLEGQDDDRASWLRVLVGRAADHVARPAPPAQEPSAEELAQARIETLLTMRVEGKRLSTGPSPAEQVRAIVLLGASAQLEARIAELEAGAPFRARWLRVLACRARGEPTREALRALVSAWLAPATSADSANQVLLRSELLAAFEGSDELADLRQRVADAPDPEVYVADGDFF